MTKEQFLQHMESVARLPNSIIHPPQIAKTLFSWMASNDYLESIVLSSFAGAIEKDKQAVCIIVDLLQLLEKLVEGDADLTSKYAALVTALAKRMPDEIFQERLDLDCLEKAGLISSKKQFSVRYVKIKTKSFYRQHKFNLFCEESEGFAKLITLLNSLSPETDPDDLLKSVQGVIGVFCLDPNRILDVILTSFEHNLNNKAIFLSFFKKYVCEDTITNGTLLKLLGRNFTCSVDPEDNKGYDTLTPKSLYNVAAILIKENLISIEELLPYLSPDDDIIDEIANKELQQQKARLAQLNVLSLSAAEDAEDKANQNSTYNVLLSFSQKYANDQKVGLLAALFEEGVTDIGYQMIQHLGTHYCLNCLDVSRTMVTSVADKVHAFLLSCTSNKVVTKESASDFCEALQLLDRVSCHLAKHPHHLALTIKAIESFYCLIKVPSSPCDPTFDRDDPAMEVFFQTITTFDECILPSFSLMNANCPLSYVIWDALKHLPYAFRFDLYGGWLQRYNTDPVLMNVKVEVSDRIKYLMKRVTASNIKQSSRHIGKICHANPLIVIDYLLSTIQRFPNLCQQMVDVLRNMNPFTFDVTIFLLIRAFCEHDRRRHKQADVNIPDWQQSLCTFTSMFLKKYSSHTDIAALLQYIFNRFCEGTAIAAEIQLFSEVVASMSGIESMETATKDHLEAVQGGDLLRQEGAYFVQIRGSAIKKSVARLRDALISQNLAVPMSLMLAKLKQNLVFEECGHLKLIGSNVDQNQGALVQYSTFLTCHIPLSEYVKTLPSLHDLVHSHGLTPESAFHVLRPVLPVYVSKKLATLIDKDGFKACSAEEKANYQVRAARLIHDELVETAKTFPSLLRDPLSESTGETVQQSPGGTSFVVSETLHPDLYVAFWAHAISDIRVPKDAYRYQSDRIDGEIKTANEASTAPNSSNSQKRKEKEKERALKVLKDRLADEEQQRDEHVEYTIKTLSQFKEVWFKTWRQDTMTYLLQYCIIPRALFSYVDAIYSAQFISLMHNLEVVSFSAAHCFDRVFGDITFLLSALTEEEVKRYGTFLKECLIIVNRWHSSKSIYEKECSQRFIISTVGKKYLDYEGYRHLCYKWHHILTKSLVGLLDSKVWLEIRNALLLLSIVADVYPRVIFHGDSLAGKVGKLYEAEKEKREDLYQLAFANWSILTNNKKTWIKTEKFHEAKQTSGNSTPVAKVENDARSAKKETANRTASPVGPKKSSKLSRSPPPRARDSKGSRESSHDRPRKKSSRSSKVK